MEIGEEKKDEEGGNYVLYLRFNKLKTNRFTQRPIKM